MEQGPSDSSPARQESAWDKLRRRKVVQWGIAYAAGAWGFLQGLEYVSDTFGWPAQFQQLATIGLAIGLPLVLVIAWYHGDRGHQRVTAAELAIITLLFLVGGGIFWRYDHRPEPAGTAATGTESPAADQPASTATAPADASVAVLPFANMSDEPGAEYFSDGLAEEILNALAQVPDLRVPSRTSSFSFRGQQVNLRAVAETLQVAHVLEGSVRRDGQRIRVTAQLIDARSDSHLWSKTWDRELRDVFQVQQEIAGEIAKSLQVQFGSPGNQPRSVGTENVEAYERYLQARHFWRQRGAGPLRESIRLFEEAIRLDPGFARAHSGLAASTAVLVAYTGPEVDAEAQANAAQAQAMRALSLDPSLAEAHAVLASILENRWNYLAAEAEYQRAIALDPSDSLSQQWYAEFLIAVGRFKDSAKYISRALELDPLSPPINLSAAYVALGNGLDVDTCARLAQRSADLGFGQRGLDGVATCHLVGGHPERARGYVQDGSTQAAVLDAIMDPAKKPAAFEFLKNAPAGGKRAASVLDTQLTAYIYMGELDLAHETARRAIADRSFWGPDVVAPDTSHYMRQFRADPRFEQLMRDSGLLDYWRSAGWADLCQAQGDGVVCALN